VRIGAVGSWLLLSIAAACGGSTNSGSKGSSSTGNGGSSDDSGPSGSSGTGGTSGRAGSSGGSGATSATGGTGTAGSSAGGGGTTATGGGCASPANCYPNLDGTALQGGQIVCLNQVPGGYCTHGCTSDADCCAVPGECRTNVSQVCGPFESTGQLLCFVSCDPIDIQWSGLDETSYCQAYVHPSFSCRSTGGGTTNRFVCVP